MRRPAAALLGTLAGTVLLVGAKYGSASPAATAGDTVAAGDAGTAGDTAGAPSAVLDGSAGAPAQNPSAAPGPSGRSATSGTGTPAPGRTTGRPTGAATTTAAAPACTTKSGAASSVASPGVGNVTVTIQVCGGVLKTATAAQSRSNWDKNTAALPALNSLAVKNYKTNFSAIHYSGATLTSNAYQASLRSAMSQAGI